jgi:hypothetical protein
LDDNGRHKDHEEQFVIEELLKNVKFICFQLSGIDFVKDLKQDEHIEEDRVVFPSLIVPFLYSNR